MLRKAEKNETPSIIESCTPIQLTMHKGPSQVFMVPISDKMSLSSNQSKSRKTVIKQWGNQVENSHLKQKSMKYKKQKTLSKALGKIQRQEILKQNEMVEVQSPQREKSGKGSVQYTSFGVTKADLKYRLSTNRRSQQNRFKNQFNYLSKFTQPVTTIDSYTLQSE